MSVAEFIFDYTEALMENDESDNSIKLSDVLISALGWSVNDQVELNISQDGALEFKKTTAQAADESSESDPSL